MKTWIYKCDDVYEQTVWDYHDENEIEAFETEVSEDTKRWANDNDFKKFPLRKNTVLWKLLKRDHPYEFLILIWWHFFLWLCIRQTGTAKWCYGEMEGTNHFRIYYIFKLIRFFSFFVFKRFNIKQKQISTSGRWSLKNAPSRMG